MKSIKEETVSGVKWAGLETISTKAVSFFIGLLVARILSPEDYGTIGMISIFMAISQTFIDSGFAYALVRKIDRTESDYSTLFYFNIVIGLLCYLILFVSAPFIAGFFHTPILIRIIRVYAISLTLNSLTIVQSAKLTIELNFKAQAIVSFIGSLSSGLVGLFLAYSGFGVWTLVWQSLFGTAIRLFLIWAFARWRPMAPFSWDSFKDLFSFGSKLLASGMLHTIYTNLSNLAIGRYYTPEDLGYYSRGSQFAALPSSTITGVLQKVTYPILSNIQNDERRLIDVYRRYICISSVVIFFLMCMLAALAKPVIILLLTDKWANAVIYLQITCFAMMFDHICRINLNLLQVKGRSDLFLKLEIIKKALAFAILCAAIPLGVKAICISSVIYTQIAVYINTYYTGKLFGLGYIAQLKDFSKYLLLSVLCSVPAFILSMSDIHPLISLSCGGIIAIVLYYFFLRKDSNMVELIELSLSLIRKKAR